MSYPPLYARIANFNQNENSGVAFNTASLDAEFNAIKNSLNQCRTFLTGIANSDATLKSTPTSAAKTLLSSNRFSATSGQTAFVVPTYNTSLDVVLVWVNGLMLDPASVTLTDTTHVTISARTTGDLVLIQVYSQGAGLLATLASTATGQGAALIGVEDAGSLLVATTVEGALAEIIGALNTLTTNIGTLTNYVKTDGSIAFSANQPMGGHKLTGLGAGTANGDSVRYEDLQAVIAQLNATTSTFLAKSGGTMTGAIAMGTNKVTGVGDPTAAQDAATKNYVDNQLASFGGLPIGTIIDFAGATAPSGWLVCDGAAIARTTYANLFAAIGVAWGIGDGVNTFNVPDLQGRVTVGAGSGSALTVRALADSGGEETHLLTTTELPAHTHSYLSYGASGTGNPGGGGSQGPFSATSGSTGGATAHNNMPPYKVTKKLIKT